MHFIRLYNKCRQVESAYFLVLFRAFIYNLLKKKIIAHHTTTIKGLKNIKINGALEIGMGYFGFLHKSDRTLLNICGEMIVKGNLAIGRGCRFDIGSNAVAEFGNESYINPFSTLIIMHGLKIGNDCAISWNCQLLDEDFHQITYDGKQDNKKEILIGNHVWIGCGTHIYKGAIIPDGCVVAANSVVRGAINEKNVLIGGNPAKILKDNICWK
jgi:acetyltransferase-like isoleucine patch superfamily enzyme